MQNLLAKLDLHNMYVPAHVPAQAENLSDNKSLCLYRRSGLVSEQL